MTIYQPTQGNLQMLADRLKNGKLVAFPTETVYGLSASIYDEDACRSIFTFKNRPPTDPLIAHVSTPEEAFDLGTVEHRETFSKLTALWPGPLTIIMKAKFPPINRTITAGGDTVGVRCPDNQITRELIKLSGPLVAPSANKFGHISPICALDVQKEFSGEDVAILDGGTCSVGIESTVLEIISENSVFIFRRGGITEVEIQKVLPGCSIEFLRVSQSSAEKQKSPGTLLQHYSIKNTFCCFLTFADVEMPSVSYSDASVLQQYGNIGIINCGREERSGIEALLNIQAQYWLQIDDKPSALYYASLRELERLKVDCCIVVGNPEMLRQQLHGMDASLFDRIYRSCSGQCIRVVQ